MNVFPGPYAMNTVVPNQFAQRHQIPHAAQYHRPDLPPNVAMRNMLPTPARPYSQSDPSVSNSSFYRLTPNYYPTNLPGLELRNEPRYNSLLTPKAQEYGQQFGGYQKMARCPANSTQDQFSTPVCRIFNAEHILSSAVRQTRPSRIAIILRGLPGSGKTYAARLIKEKEVAISGTSPRILSIDDYFAAEADDKGTVQQEYEFNPTMEKSFRSSLLKSFKKTIDDGLFSFIIVDSCNDKIVYFDEFVTYAVSRGFAVYITTVHADVDQCKLRSAGRRKADDIDKMSSFWEPTPEQYSQLDISSWLHPDINTVEMEDAACSESKDDGNSRKRKHDDSPIETNNDASKKVSKWELLEASDEHINRLDGISRGKGDKKRSTAASSHVAGGLFMDSGEVVFDSIEDCESSCNRGDKKRCVSWADVEAYRKSLKERHNQFDRMLSEINARSALVKIQMI